MIESQFDVEDGVGVVVVRGKLTAADRRICLRSLERLVGGARVRIGTARVLSDAEDAAIQPREIAKAIDVSSLLGRDEGRVAVAAGSALSSTQARRALDPRISLFAGLAKELDWLASAVIPQGASS